jgi:outer membrane protein OmpA-like peptidoglycan-associated protein/opacity protein-like surface antigen
MVLSLDGGITLGKTDYTGTKPGGRFTLGIEYYLPASSNHIFGIRGYGGGQELYSTDENKIITLPDIGQITLPDLINAEMFLAGIGLIYSYSIRGKFFPYLSVGLSNIWFSPKIENGDRAHFNSINSYNRNAVVYDTDLGLKYQVSDEISLKLEGCLHFPNTDNLDDIKTGENKDFFATINLGISYSFFGKKDSDEDGILDDVDQCSDDPEDFDGFQDEDGCPDPDNDGDGIPDILDRCPDDPEDFDGFQDEDGCPDIDNDGDGILDELDECPDETEDFDGFEDDNGCPDPDNDGDGVLDIDDKCPDVPGPGSNNGCPTDSIEDGETGLAPKEITIEGESTFYTDKADIRPEAFPELDRIVQILKLYPEIDWRIEGHTDEHQEDNLMVRPLSLRRAEAILNYFVTKGLPSFQFRVYDMGERFPIANNNTQYGRMKNRRVVLIREN